MMTSNTTRAIRENAFRIGLALVFGGALIFCVGVLATPSVSAACVSPQGQASSVTPKCGTTTTTTTTKPQATTTTSKPSTPGTVAAATTPPPGPTTPGTVAASPVQPSSGAGILPFTGFSGVLKVLGIGLFLVGLGFCLVHFRKNRAVSEQA